MTPTRVNRIFPMVLWLAAGLGCGLLSNASVYKGVGVLGGRIAVGGNPVGGALVFALGDHGGKVTSGPGGDFALIAPAGRGQQLVVMWGTDLGLRTSYTLAGRGTIELGDLQLVPTGILEGSVELSPDPWEAEVWVQGTPFVARPDFQGRYNFNLPEGLWTLVISAPGRQDLYIQDVLVESGTTRQVDPATPPADPGYTCVGTDTRTERFTQGGGGGLDILFVLDNSGSMVGEQAALADSFNRFVEYLDEGEVDYHIAVVTTGMESGGCPACDAAITDSCINPTGENGRFQNRCCQNQGTEDEPDYLCETDPNCRVVDAGNLACFYDRDYHSGTVLVGVKGCGYERGLAAMRTALQDGLLETYNQGFLREAARLAVIVVSDEEDCGEVGDVWEGSGVGGDICYYAAKGAGPEGEVYHPDDPQQRPYQLTPVGEYAQFLLELKSNQSWMVKFAAIVGVEDAGDPLGTDIQYEWSGTRWDVVDACTTPGCNGSYCFAEPGTRYIRLADMLDGTVESICQTDFAEPMVRIAGASTGYLLVFPLHYLPTSEASIRVWVDGVEQISGEWIWDQQRQAVVFSSAHAPSSYSLVTVEYQTDCR